MHRLVIIAILLVPGAAAAAPTALLTWQLETLAGCYRAMDDQYLEAGTRLGVGVTGPAEPFTAYAVSIDALPQDGLPMPEAWRFEPGGCQLADRVSWKTHPSPGSPCGWLFAMSSEPPPSTAITFDAGANRLRLEFSISLPQAAEPFPGDESLVTIVAFDHRSSVPTIDAAEGDCGGRERPMCFSLRSLRFQRPDGSWFEADRPTPVITMNAASWDGPAGCSAVPARPATWGAVKGRYR